MCKTRTVWCQKCSNIGELYIVNLDTGVTEAFPCDACDGKGYNDVPEDAGQDAGQDAEIDTLKIRVAELEGSLRQKDLENASAVALAMSHEERIEKQDAQMAVMVAALEIYGEAISWSARRKPPPQSEFHDHWDWTRHDGPKSIARIALSSAPEQAEKLLVVVEAAKVLQRMEDTDEKREDEWSRAFRELREAVRALPK